MFNVNPTSQELIALYIGAGCDVRPIEALAPGVRRFLFVDSRPSTEWPTVEPRNRVRQIWFVDELLSKICSIGFNHEPFMVSQEPFFVEFVRSADDVRVLYFFNTPFPVPADEEFAAYHQLNEEMASANMLVVAGHHPHYSVLDRMTTSSPIRLATFERTVYSLDTDEPDTVISELYRNPSRVGSITHYRKLYVGTDVPSLDAIESLPRLC